MEHAAGWSQEDMDELIDSINEEEEAMAVHLDIDVHDDGVVITRRRWDTV